MEDELLNEIRQVKKHCTSDKFDYDEDGYGELNHMVFTALDIADELREAVLIGHNNNKRVVYGKDVPGHYAITIMQQMERIKRLLGNRR